MIPCSRRIPVSPPNLPQRPDDERRSPPNPDVDAGGLDGLDDSGRAPERALFAVTTDFPLRPPRAGSPSRRPCRRRVRRGRTGRRGPGQPHSIEPSGKRKRPDPSPRPGPRPGRAGWDPDALPEKISAFSKRSLTVPVPQFETDDADPDLGGGTIALDLRQRLEHPLRRAADRLPGLGARSPPARTGRTLPVLPEADPRRRPWPVSKTRRSPSPERLGNEHPTRTSSPLRFSNSHPMQQLLEAIPALPIDLDTSSTTRCTPVGQRHRGGNDLDRLEHPVVEVALDPGQRSDQPPVSDDNDAPIRAWNIPSAWSTSRRPRPWRPWPAGNSGPCTRRR